MLNVWLPKFIDPDEFDGLVAEEQRKSGISIARSTFGAELLRFAVGQYRSAGSLAALNRRKSVEKSLISAAEEALGRKVTQKESALLLESLLKEAGRLARKLA